MAGETTLADVLGEAEDGAVSVGGKAYAIYPLRLRDYGRIQRVTGEADLSLSTLDGMAAAVWCNMQRSDPGLAFEDVETLFNIQDADAMAAFTTMFARVMRASGLVGAEESSGTAKKGIRAEPKETG